MSEFTPVAATAEYDLVVNGVAIHYATWGKFTGPERTVMFVHGITSSHKNWTLLAPVLADAGWYVIAPDLRGRGLSDKPAHGYAIPFHANDILGLCDKLGLAQVNVVGHSLGASITLYLASLYPDRVSKAVLVDGGAVTPPEGIAAIQSSLSRLGVVYPSLDAYLDARRAAAPFPWNAYWEQYYRYDVQEQPDGTVISRVPKAAIIEELAALNATRLEALPADVRAPTLITWAAEGTIATDRGFILPEAAAQRLHEGIAGSRISKIANVNHYTITTADTLIIETAAFLTEQG